CPDRRFQWVRFDNNPDSLLSMAAPEATVRTGRFLNLPTPTLAGLPADEAAYEALLHGYARLVAARVIAEQTGWECCFSESDYPGILFYSALVDVQLARLGLSAGPFDPAAQATLHSQPLLLVQLHDIWNLPQAEAFADPYNRAVAAATVTFMLRENPDLDVLQMQHDLARGPRFGPWYTTFLPDGLSDEATNRWLRFLGSGDSAALPSDILAFCERNLYQYEVLADSWKPLTNSRSPNVVGRLFQYPGPAGPL